MVHNALESFKPLKKVNACYKELKTDLQPILSTDSDYNILKSYFANAHPHRKFKLSVLQVGNMYNDDKKCKLNLHVFSPTAGKVRKIEELSWRIGNGKMNWKMELMRKINMI